MIARPASSVMVLLFFIQLLSFSSAPSFGAQPQATEARLRQRVSGFWTAWKENNAQKLASLVLAEDRTDFLRLPRFVLFDFHIDSFQMTPDRKSAVVTTRIKRQFPMRTSPVEWGLENEWVFTGGDWYLHYVRVPQQGGLFTGPGDRDGSRNAPTEPPRLLSFGETQYDFGVVAAGSRVYHEFHFKNTERTPIRITRVMVRCNEPPGSDKCVLAQSDGSVFMPGSEGKIRVGLPDSLTALKVNQEIEIDLDTGGSIILHFVGEITAPLNPK